MDRHSFLGKREFCYTDVLDFTDIQGLGSDPLYNRYNSVESVVKRFIAPQYQHFFATPQYNHQEDQIGWYINEWEEHPVKLSSLSGGERNRYEAIKDETLKEYRSVLSKIGGEDLQILAGALVGTDDDERIYCCDGKVYAVAWGMKLDTNRHKVIGSVIHEIDSVKRFKITFDVGEHGQLASKLDKSINRKENETISAKDLPVVNANEGWIFDGWQPSPIGITVKSDLTFTATYKRTEDTKPDVPILPIIDVIEEPEPEEKFYNCKFDAGEHGTINGSDTVRVPENSTLSANEIPSVTPKDGYKFKGWNVSPIGTLVNEDKTFSAQYDKIPWYRRWWLWLTGKGCLKWLLWFLLFLLAVILLSFLLDCCHGCSHRGINGVTPIDSITRADGRVVDDNGHIKPITGDDGRLPNSDGIVAPVTGEGGEEVPIIERPGVPNIIANRLFLFMEDENDDIEALAQDFKKAYPEDKYSIIGYDKEVKLLVIQIPEAERDQIRQTINDKIPNHKFIVFDEEVYELNGSINTQAINPGWHLKAIHLQEGWKVTKGDAKVKVAVVDDGIEAAHPMFKGRIVDAYNVFTQSNNLSMGVGHGTHTAGLASGSAEYYSKGAAGVAPNCKLMPIQVFDNGQCPLSALVAGVMYAVHHDADVVNISIGPSFQGLNQLPVEEQNQIAQQQFKNVEMLWARVCKLAAKKNTILVFAAGNDDILSSIPPENRNESAIVVAAVDENLYPTDFTNYGPCSDISAPGKDIYSSYPRGDFKSFDGTSMAAPIVTGTIALMKSLKKDLTVEQVRNVLYKTGADVYGFIPPMVLVDKALQRVKSGDFSAPKERTMKPVPEGEGDDSSAGSASPIVSQPTLPVPPTESNETDYDAIRRKIAEYKQKITELEKLLPSK